MNLTLKHPQALRVAFLRYVHLENLEQYENLSSVCYYDSNDPDEFEALPNNKVVIKYGSWIYVFSIGFAFVTLIAKYFD